MKERIKASLWAAFNAAKLRINGLRPFNAPAARFKSTAFWPFPKPKTPEQWWWLAGHTKWRPPPTQPPPTRPPSQMGNLLPFVGPQPYQWLL